MSGLQWVFKLKYKPKQAVIHNTIGTLRSHKADGNQEVKEAIGLTTKTTILHMHHAFLYISLLSLHNYDVKMPNFTFYRGSTQATMKFSLYF